MSAELFAYPPQVIYHILENALTAKDISYGCLFMPPHEKVLADETSTVSTGCSESPGFTSFDTCMLYLQECGKRQISLSEEDKSPNPPQGDRYFGFVFLSTGKTYENQHLCMLETLRQK